MDDDSTYERFTTEIAGARVLARVPVAAKKMCERLMRKSDHNEDEADYLHENYWVEVHYRGTASRLQGHRRPLDLLGKKPPGVLAAVRVDVPDPRQAETAHRPSSANHRATGRRGLGRGPSRPVRRPGLLSTARIHAVVCPLRRGPIRGARVVQRQNATGRFPVLLFRSPGADRRVGHSGV